MNDTPYFPPGLQVAYVPSHAHGHLDHPDVELGFVQEDQGDSCLCRFWRRHRTHKHQIGELRTKANAESAQKRDLIPHQHCRQELIDNFLRVRGKSDLNVRKMWGMPVGARKLR